MEDITVDNLQYPITCRIISILPSILKHDYIKPVQCGPLTELNTLFDMLGKTNLKFPEYTDFLKTHLPQFHVVLVCIYSMYHGTSYDNKLKYEEPLTILKLKETIHKKQERMRELIMTSIFQVIKFEFNYRVKSRLEMCRLPSYCIHMGAYLYLLCANESEQWSRKFITYCRIHTELHDRIISIARNDLTLFCGLVLKVNPPLETKITLVLQSCHATDAWSILKIPRDKFQHQQSKPLGMRDALKIYLQGLNS